MIACLFRTATVVTSTNDNRYALVTDAAKLALYLAPVVIITPTDPLLSVPKIITTVESPSVLVIAFSQGLKVGSAFKLTIDGLVNSGYTETGIVNVYTMEANSNASLEKKTTFLSL